MTTSTYSFVPHGLEIHHDVFSRLDCSRLLKEALSSRTFEDIFLTANEYKLNQSISGNNPRPGRNLLSRLDTEFIFSNVQFQKTMSRLLGPRWRILDYKFVVGLDEESIPNWLLEELDSRPIANLGPYIKEEFRDMTYFRGIDFHQDILDFPDRESDFITVYVYLDDVDSQSAPLFVIPSSHVLGATVFPHKLTKLGENLYLYEDDSGRKVTVSSTCLTGSAGTLYCWHSTTLHGTQPAVGHSKRISVRILAEKNSRTPNSCELDTLNDEINGPLSLLVTRRDLDQAGNLIVRQNLINTSES